MLPLSSCLHSCICFYAVLLLGGLLILYPRFVKMRRYRNQAAEADIPPGSCGLPLIGETIQFMAAMNNGRGFCDFVRARRLRYGNCFKTNILGLPQVFVSSTESARKILNNESGKFTKRYIKSIAELVGDQSLLCASHGHHKLIRGCLAYLFSTSSVSVFIKQFDELVVKSLGSWQDGDKIVVLHQATEITFKAMCRMLMSLENEPELQMLQEDITHVCEAMLAFPIRLPWTRFYKGLKARKRIMSTLDLIMTERRRCSHGNQKDFMQCLLVEDEKAGSDETYRMTDTEIKDNILTMIIAGQDTTASAITWMVKYLGENQHVLDTLRAEQLHRAEKMSPGQFLTLEDLAEMPYASKVVKESLRMASVVPWFPRLALQDCEIEGFKIKKGWNINVDATSIHLDPNQYNEPNKFNPSRFNDDSKAPYSFLAFGMGARTCLGVNMAKAMMLVFLHRLITTYKWKVIDSDSSIEKWTLFSRLKSGCPVQVTCINHGKDVTSTYGSH
ncbi:hypothetical protein OIU78_012733 [Salix suchowensis]|nr:hypothetical protein OIU78_012733 [Salix suchowensis]